VIPEVNIPGSKSISNRLLIIKAVGKLSFTIQNQSNSDDTKALLEALKGIDNQASEINVHHAGSTFRFLCALLAATENTSCILTGSSQLQKRPIKALVNALSDLGADITYTNEHGYPPLLIKGKKLQGGHLHIDSSVSSQFISALMLIAPLLPEGLFLTLNGKTVSSSYISLTAKLMSAFGVKVVFHEKKQIDIQPSKYTVTSKEFFNESDWSAAGYFYAAMALSNIPELKLNGLTINSSQPDAITAELFQSLGVETHDTNNGIVLKKTKPTITYLHHDFTECPDIAQTIAVTCAALGIKGEFSGLQTLLIKETNRLLALKTELEKLGCEIVIKENSLIINKPLIAVKKEVNISTYNDHRMAMSFAPLTLIYPSVFIQNKEVVSKSFPNFWSEFKKLY
jgi:3-phosphoshikimate 1-carboxyvinyltransferase